jgi:hypothetical protein
MSKLIKRIMTGALALAMVMGTVLSVAAAAPTPAPLTTPGLVADSKGMISKILRKAPGVNTTEDFSFDVTRVGLAGADGKIVTGSAGDMPNIGTVTMPNSLFTGFLPSSTVLGMEEKFAQVDLLDGITFPHAGVYVYTVAEYDNGLAVSQMSYSKAQYQMVVYVENDMVGATTEIDDPNAPKVTNVGFRKIVDEAGEEVHEVTGGTDDMPLMTSGKVFAKTDPIFVNEYRPLADFEIAKIVAGEFGNTEQTFEFTLDITRPATEGLATEGSAQVYNGRKISAAGTETPVTVTFPATVRNTTQTFGLKHNEKIIFDSPDNTITTSGGVTGEGLPAGSTYKLTETGVEGYTTVTALVWDNIAEGTGVTATPSGSVTTEWLLPASNSYTLGEAVNRTVWTNTYRVITPTGILLNNLPFILLIMVSVGGFTLYIASKRRKAMK